MVVVDQGGTTVKTPARNHTSKGKHSNQHLKQNTMKKGSFTFATSEDLAKARAKNGAEIEEIDDNRWAVTYPIDPPKTIKEVEELVDSFADDIDTFTIKDPERNTLWTEEDFE